MTIGAVVLAFQCNFKEPLGDELYLELKVILEVNHSFIHCVNIALKNHALINITQEKHKRSSFVLRIQGLVRMGALKSASRNKFIQMDITFTQSLVFVDRLANYIKELLLTLFHEAFRLLD